MSITYKEIEDANNLLISTDIKGKSYIEVNQRIKAFRMVYPEGFIKTEMVSNENGVCMFKAVVGNEDKILGIGHAYEKEGSTFINKTSCIENCETSAVGRALGMAGFGIDVSVASAEEVQNAILNQDEPEKKATPKQIEFLLTKYEGANLEKLLATNNITKIEDLPMQTASKLITKLKERK